MIKALAKKLLRALPFPLTKNERYDRLTARIIRRVVAPGSACVDVGCHTGEILDLMLRASPTGQHWAFEPIPALYAVLQEKYHACPCTISPFALSDHTGEAAFNHVLTNPAYSGLRRRAYDRPSEQDETISVRTARLDDVLPPSMAPVLIKIDVEGAELGVLRGAEETLKQSRPIVIFEHGLGASDVYGTTPEIIHAFFAGLGYGIHTLDGWLRGAEPLTEEDFRDQFCGRKNHYFLAAPGQRATTVS